jgi:GntR family transcriptional regulator
MPPKKLTPRTAMFRQLADTLADEIEKGTFPPGTALPSETQLMKDYGVSRITARSAFAELRQMGLITAKQGIGSIVRQQAVPAAVIERTISRCGPGFVGGPGFDEIEDPTVTRGHTSGLTCELLGRQEAAVFTVNRLMGDDATGARAAHRMTIPFDVAEKVPELEEAPDAAPPMLYSALAAAGYALEWSETVTARSPKPDERSSLHMDDTTQLLVAYRITADEETHQPLLLEELRASASSTRLMFRVIADKPVDLGS